MDKHDAKTAAALLNTQKMGTSKGKPYYDELWTIKYLPKFKWHHLTDQMGIKSTIYLCSYYLWLLDLF